MDGRPLILWLGDSPNWAYGAIFRAQSQSLPGYRHEYFCMARRWPVEDLRRFQDYMERATVIVAMYIGYLEVVPVGKLVVLMLTGPRPFEQSASDTLTSEKQGIIIAAAAERPPQSEYEACNAN